MAQRNRFASSRSHRKYSQHAGARILHTENLQLQFSATKILPRASYPETRGRRVTIARNSRFIDVRISHVCQTSRGKGSWTHAKGHLCAVSSNHLKEEKRASPCRSDVHVQENAASTLDGEVIYHWSLSYSRVTEEFRSALPRRTEPKRMSLSRKTR